MQQTVASLQRMSGSGCKLQLKFVNLHITYICMCINIYIQYIHIITFDINT